VQILERHRASILASSKPPAAGTETACRTSPRSVAAEANETGGQLVARWRGEWFEPRREQLPAVEARPHQTRRVMTRVSKEVCAGRNSGRAALRASLTS